MTFSKIILLFILVLALVFPSFLLAEENLEESCLLLTKEGCQGISSTECRKALEKCGEYYKEKSAQIEADITKTSEEKRTLQNKIYSLNKKIQNLDYQIYESSLVIKDLEIQIDDTSQSIEETTANIEESKRQLVGILRSINEKDQKSVIEILLAEEDISDFFDDLVALEILNSKNKDLLKDIKLLKTNLIDEKQALSGEKDDIGKMIKIHQLQKAENKKIKQDQQYYLNITEQEYQKQLQEKKNIEQRAAKIRARIFELVGVPKAPTFGEAYKMAKYVESILGIRPAFLLAVLQQESAIGKNVGQCYLKNSKTGSGVVIYNGKAVDRVMKPTRDVSPFLLITKELGRDPYQTPVSCPMSYGYGGAMGPAQFIPSTWMLYKNRLKGLLGRACDPWNIQDAFVAAGLYLVDNGAANRTHDSEWRSAMIYFSGSTTNSAFYWYADQVLNKAAQFEKDIKTLESAR